MKTQTAKALTDSVFEKLTIIPESPAQNIDLREVAFCLEEYLNKCREEGISEARDWLNSNERYVSMLSAVGYHPAALQQLAEASAIGIDDLEARVADVAEDMLDMLLEDQITDQKGEDATGCWNYLDSKKPEGGKTSNAWLTATCLYALWKAVLFLFSDSQTEKINLAIDRGIKWLFRKDVFCEVETKKGWTSTPVDEKSDGELPMIHDSAYVLNILLRIRPQLDYDYESILEFLLESRNKALNYWAWNRGDEIDIRGTSLNLRLLGNYGMQVKKRPANRYSNELHDRVLECQNSVCLALARSQLPSGSWPATPAGISKYEATASAVHALRTAGRGRDWSGVTEACNWLLSSIDYFDGSWCWTGIEDATNQRYKSVQDSAVSVSALLKSTTFQKFSRIEAVIFWLMKEIEEKRICGSLEMATVLCAFADYLRAFREPGFFV